MLNRPGAGVAESSAAPHLASDSIFDNSELRPHWGELTPDSGTGDEFRKALSTMDEKLLDEKAFDRSLVDQEIRYHMPEAAEVFLMWGVNGWKKLPDGERPPGTELAENGVMSTPMGKSGDGFVVTLRVPRGTNINFGFWVGKKRDGSKAGIWDGEEYAGLGYQVVVRPSHPVEVVASLTMARFREPGMTTEGLATQEIVYPLSGAQEVVLVWGINGWGFMAESARPRGTVIKEGKMMTPLQGRAGSFRAILQVPPGTTIDYGFIVTRTSDGRSVDLWDNNRQQFFHVKVAGNGSVTVKPTVKLLK